MKDSFANISANSPSSNTHHQERQDNRFHDNGYEDLPSLGHDNTEYTNHAEGAYLTEESLHALKNILANLNDKDLEDMRNDSDDTTLRRRVFKDMWAYLVAQENDLHWKTNPNKGQMGATKKLASTQSHFTPKDEKDFIYPSDLIKFLLEKILPTMNEDCEEYVIGTKLLSVLKESTSVTMQRKRKCTTLFTPPISLAKAASPKKKSRAPPKITQASSPKKKSGSSNETQGDFFTPPGSPGQAASPKKKKPCPAPEITQASSPKKKKPGSCNGTQSGKKSACKNDSSKKKGNGKNSAPSNVIDGVDGSRFSQFAELVTWLREGYITREQFDALKNELFREQL